MNPVTKQRMLFAVLAVFILAAVALFWPRAIAMPQADPPMSAEALAAMPDDQLLHAAVTELRWSMAGDAVRQSHWREMNEAARTVMALAWVENGNLRARMDGFSGFGILFALEALNRPSGEDLALAYEHLGAPEMAQICREAQRITDQGMPTATDQRAYAEPDEKFRRVRGEIGSTLKIQAYIRQHAAEITSVRNH